MLNSPSFPLPLPTSFLFPFISMQSLRQLHHHSPSLSLQFLQRRSLRARSLRSVQQPAHFHPVQRHYKSFSLCLVIKIGPISGLNAIKSFMVKPPTEGESLKVSGSLYHSLNYGKTSQQPTTSLINMGHGM